MLIKHYVVPILDQTLVLSAHGLGNRWHLSHERLLLGWWPVLLLLLLLLLSLPRRFRRPTDEATVRVITCTSELRLSSRLFSPSPRRLQ